MQIKNYYQQLGLSYYLTTSEQKYLKKGRGLGINKLFISLHIIEQFHANYLQAVTNFLASLKTWNFKEIICDISPIGIEKLGPNWLSLLQKYGITTVRCDYGFSNQEIVTLAQKITVAINASQVKEDLLIALLKANLIKNVIAIHNYYPLPGTGLSKADMIKKDSLLRSFGINTIYSFIAGQKNWRMHSLNSGLPTLEKHRQIKANDAFNELINIFKHTCVFIGDPDLFIIKKPANLISLKLKKPIYLENKTYDLRISNNFVRFKNTRFMPFSQSGISNQKHENIKPTIIPNIKVGDLVIANANAKRYMGEIMLCIKPLDFKYNHFFNFLTHVNINETQIITMIKTKKITISSSQHK